MIDERIAVSRCGSRRASPTAKAAPARRWSACTASAPRSAGWLLQLETLKGYRLIAWDAPGYGESEFLPLAEPRPADYAQALHEFLDRLLLKDVVLVANSLGCLMASAYAAARPERVRSMVLLGPAAGYGGDEAKTATGWALRGARPRRPRRAAVADAGGDRDSPPDAVKLVAGRSGASSSELRRAVHCLTPGRLRRRRTNSRRRFSSPTAAEDTVTPEASCKAVAAAFPRCRHRSLRASGMCLTSRRRDRNRA